MGWGKWEPRWGQEEVCKEGGRDTIREWARRKPEDHPRGGWRREQGAKVVPFCGGLGHGRRRQRGC